MNVTKADALWLLKLLTIILEVYDDYPELFNKEDEETLAIAGELIRSIQ